MAGLGFGCTPIKPEKLLLLIEKQLKDGGTPTNSIRGGGLGADAFLSMWPDQWHMKNPRSKRFVAIRPARFPVWQSIVQGSGTDYTGFDDVLTTFGFNLVFTASIFQQLNGSPEMRSTTELAEEAAGQIQYVMKIISALQFWHPKDAPGVNGNELLREPCRLLDGGFQLRPVESGTQWWVHATADFECKHTAEMPVPS